MRVLAFLTELIADNYNIIIISLHTLSFMVKKNPTSPTRPKVKK